MARFLLIHGASHGAWCWDRLIPLLEEAGHNADAIDLPGHGNDQTPRARVRMADYTRAVARVLKPGTILVGHSFGGFPITLAAAERPDDVAALVYLCALVPQSGKAFTDFRQEAISPSVSEVQIVDRPAGVTHVIPEKAGDVFYSGCNEADRAFALARVTPQPIGVMTEAVTFARPDTPRHYIRCSEDRVVMPSYQRAVSANWPDTYDLAAGHSPFFEAPEELASILNTIAGSE